MKLCKHIVQRAFHPSGFLLLAITLFILFVNSEECNGQQRIAHVQPDALGPGMTIAMEVLAPAKDTGAFGADGIYVPSAKISLINTQDSFNVIFGPVIVSWHGRVLQVPVMVKPQAASGRTVQFQIITGNKKSDTAAFEIALVQPKLSFFGGATLGDGFSGQYSFHGAGNTIVADEIELLGPDIFNKGLFYFSTIDTDLSVGNPHYHPVTLLSRGPIHLRFAQLSVSADFLNGGPGGGGGGAGFAGTGGAGYTGGGSDSDYSPLNVGSGDNSTINSGGASSTGVAGGASSFIAPNIDQGGGGGTGCPYGSSGSFSAGNEISKPGGFGGGSAGGESINNAFGGGGGAFASDGSSGAGEGNNGGKSYGGRFIVPMQGGSGGGAGNSEHDSTAGSGGGGGGALTLISYDTLSIINSSISANGFKGTDGLTDGDGGGGGGSGGGLLISARNGIAIGSSTISADSGLGGLGGLGTQQSSKGGNGGTGRIRIDGEITAKDTNNLFSGAQASGPSINIPLVKLNAPFALVTGLAGDSTSLTDSIRIYYRNHHSSWSFVDTIRFKSNGKFRWQKFLPMGHDSSLFVTAMAQVRNPSQKFANFEPARLLSHLSSGILRVNATPHLVLEQDTLIFGCYKIGDTCVSATLYFSNLGEDSLRIKSIAIPSGNFSITSKKTDTVGYYLRDSVIIQYCPTKVGKDTQVITFKSNDTTRTAVLIGCGIDKDTKITLKPTTLDFGKVKVDQCDTLSFTARSVGNDPALFSPDNFSHPPFTIIQPKKDTLLARKDTLHVVVSFCPGDTGDFHSSFIVTEKRDSVIVSGIGTRTSRILFTEQNIQEGRICVGDCNDTLHARFITTGNDTVSITGIIGKARFVPDIFPIRIPPQTDTELVFHYCATEKGDSKIPIAYHSNADSLVDTTFIHYYGVKPEFIFDYALHFGALCLPGADSLPFSIHRIGADTINISSIHLGSGLPFSLSGDTSSKIDSTHFMVHFAPTASASFRDTLLLTLSSGVCDSIVKIPIEGSADTSNVQFSPLSISFGSVDTGSCKVDSVSVTATCAIVVQIPPVSAPFSIVSPISGSLSLLSGETKSIIYQYCPKAISGDSAVQTFNSFPNGPFDLKLSGVGVPSVDSPFVRFRLDTVTANAGVEFLYRIFVESISSGTNITTLQGSLHYDPTLIEPLSVKGDLWTVVGSETTPGTYQFSGSNTTALATGKFATIQMLPLYGSHDTTSVFLDNVSAINSASTATNIGFIKIIACGNLAGKIIAAGAYALGNPTPNPAKGNISFPVTLGTDGILHIKMYTPSGMTTVDKLFDLKRGENTIVLDVSTLTSGIYYLSADSWGWRDGRTLVIEK